MLAQILQMSAQYFHAKLIIALEENIKIKQELVISLNQLSDVLEENRILRKKSIQQAQALNLAQAQAQAQKHCNLRVFFLILIYLLFFKAGDDHEKNIKMSENIRRNSNNS